MKETPERQRRRMSRMGKRRLETLTQARRTILAYQAGVQGGRPRVIDHDRVRALQAQGLKHREIAAELDISMPSVARILREARLRASREVLNPQLRRKREEPLTKRPKKHAAIGIPDNAKLR